MDTGIRNLFGSYAVKIDRILLTGLKKILDDRGWERCPERAWLWIKMGAILNNWKECSTFGTVDHEILRTIDDDLGAF